MKEKSEHKIIPELRLIIQFHKGELNFNGKTVADDIANDPLYNSDYPILVDLTKVEQIDLSNNELIEYGNYVKNKLNLKTNKKIALITELPILTAKAMIYSLNRNLPQNTYEIFSTHKSALNWLEIDTKYLPIVEETIESLNK